MPQAVDGGRAASSPRLYMLECGTFRTRLDMVKLHMGLGEDYEVPIPWFVVVHPDGNVVIDGGNPPAAAIDPVAHWGTAVTDLWSLDMRPEQAVLPQLEVLRIAPESVRWILQSHLHLDHVGAVAVAEAFPNAQLLATRREYEYALHPDWFCASSYVRADFDRPGLDWVLLDDDEDGYDVFGDGVLRCWNSPGHSPGHQSFTVTLADAGTFLLAGDAAYTMDHWEERALPGGMTSAIEVARSVRRLRRLAERDRAVVVPGHDPDVWPRFARAPQFYA